MTRILSRSLGGGAVCYERGTPALGPPTKVASATESVVLLPACSDYRAYPKELDIEVTQ
jgi:hypothetical protein